LRDRMGRERERRVISEAGEGEGGFGRKEVGGDRGGWRGRAERGEGHGRLVGEEG